MARCSLPSSSGLCLIKLYNKPLQGTHETSIRTSVGIRLLPHLVTLTEPPLGFLVEGPLQPIASHTGDNERNGHPV